MGFYLCIISIYIYSPYLYRYKNISYVTGYTIETEGFPLTGRMWTHGAKLVKNIYIYIYAYIYMFIYIAKLEKKGTIIDH